MSTAIMTERPHRSTELSHAPRLGPVGSWLAALIRASSELLDAYVIGGRAPEEGAQQRPELVVTCVLRGATGGELRCRIDRLLAVAVAEGMWSEAAETLSEAQVLDAVQELCGHVIGYAAGEVSATFPGILFDPPCLHDGGGGAGEAGSRPLAGGAAAANAPSRPLAGGAGAAMAGLRPLAGGDRAVVPSRIGSLVWEVSDLTVAVEQTRPLPHHAITVRDRIRTLRDTDLQLLQAVRVLGVDDKAEDAFEQLVRAVGSDPALTARVLRRVNSALARPRARRIQTLPQALLYIGTRTAKNIVVSALLSQPLGSPHPARVSVVNHSIKVAVLCRHLGAMCQVDPEECYLLGLLHDLGRLVLDRLFPDELGELCGPEEEVLEKEVRKLGITHTEAGSIIALAWHFPDVVRLAMTAHHDGRLIDQLGLPPEQAFLVQIVAQADRIVEEAEGRSADAEAVAETCWKADGVLNREAGAVKRCLDLATEQVKEEQLGDPI